MSTSSSRTAILTGLFGVLVFVGGLVGFINSASVVSFAFGLAFGLTLAVAAYLVSHPTTQDHGFLFSLGTRSARPACAVGGPFVSPPPTCSSCMCVSSRLQCCSAR
jgi:hypothetical protein